MKEHCKKAKKKRENAYLIGRMVSFGSSGAYNAATTVAFSLNFCFGLPSPRLAVSDASQPAIILLFMTSN